MVKRSIAVTMMLWLSLPVMAEPIEGVMLKYMVSESGLEPQPSRIIVTAEQVRMDDGEDNGNYLLFDRSRQLISSVAAEEGTVFEIPLREVKQKPPVVLKREQSLEVDQVAPPVGGKQPHKLSLFINEQAKLLDDLPEEMIDGCDLALHTFYPEWPLESGLAIQEWNNATRRGRLLVDIDPEFKIDSTLLELPSGYKHYRTP